jgi:hypothetical protein
MADVLPSQLATSVMAKLYDVLTNGDETVPQSEDNFFTWCTPGLPVEEEEFDFLSQGLTGVVKEKDLQLLASKGIEITPEVLEGLRAQDTARMYMQAENFARMVDIVPDVSQASNEQFARLNVLNNEGSVSDIYKYILRMSQVMHTELPEEMKKKVAEFRALLNVTKTRKSLIDGSETQIVEPSPLTQAYYEKMAAFESAALAYNTARIDALTASNARAVHYWAMNANILRNKVKAAMSDWVSNGYKNDYEQISAFIDQVMQRDMALLKQEYRDDLEKARITGKDTGSDFFFTSLVPGNFARSSGWTNFEFSSGDLQSHSSSNFSTSKWQTSGGGSFWGIVHARASGGKTRELARHENKFSSDVFNCSFQICQVPIVRPWFKSAFLLSKAWRFDQNDPLAKIEVVSSGLNGNGKAPTGKMPAYPTSAIFVRNLKIVLGHSEGFDEFVSEKTTSEAGGGGYLTFGGLFAGGNYSRSSTNGSTDRKWGYSWKNQTLCVDGMQLAGLKCHILPKSPDPLPGITQWV